MDTVNIVETIGQTEAVVRMTTTDKLVMADSIMIAAVGIVTIEKITTIIEKMMTDTLEEVDHKVESNRFTLAPICGILITSIKEYLMLLERTNQRK